MFTYVKVAGAVAAVALWCVPAAQAQNLNAQDRKFIQDAAKSVATVNGRP